MGVFSNTEELSRGKMVECKIYLYFDFFFFKAQHYMNFFLQKDVSQRKKIMKSTGFITLSGLVLIGTELF